MTSLHQRSAKMLATWFGLGLSPIVPGTVGTLGALPLVWWMQGLSPMFYMGVTLGFTVLAILVAQVYEILTTGHDRSEVVIDEVAGFLVAMTWIPWEWPWVLAAFALFRALDMLKPFPISWVDRKIEGGVGVVADDLLAGIICNVVLHVARESSWM